MGSSVEKIEKNIATIKIEVSADDFNKAVNKAYNKNKGRFSISGFRKGKAPRSIIERQYGENVFYEDAIDFAFPEAYSSAIEENDIQPVSRPNMENIETISSKEGFVFTVSVAVKPEVELGEYKGTEINKLDYEVTDEDIKEELEKMQNQNARLITVEDIPAKESDTVIIDFEGLVDDVPFEGGKAENYSLVLGSKSFIPGFEDQLVGLKKGEEKEVNVTFPENYQSDELAGKPAVFKTKVNEVKVKQLPELDDEFVKDISEFDNLEELKEDLKSKILERKSKELKEEAEVKVVNYAVENATLEIPEPMIEEEMEKSLKDFEYQLQTQGISMTDYFSYTNTEEEKLKEDIRTDVISRIKRDLVLTKVTEEENIVASDEEIQVEIANYAQMYKIELDKFKETIKEGEMDYFKSIVKRKSTVEFLLENAVQK
ncbi:MAG: trigger factor [Eubacteriaceae bacterium]